MHLKSLKQVSTSEVVVAWSDGHVGPIPLTLLRDACPCAGCKGETVLFQTYIPPEPDKSIPGRYELRSVSSVGNYALKPTWGDGHDMGIYTWEHLRSLCQCAACSEQRQE